MILSSWDSFTVPRLKASKPSHPIAKKIMRKIEALTLNAIDPHNSIKKDWSRKNMAVYFSSDKSNCSIYLHGNLICEVWPDEIYFQDAGWKTNTTKSRINIISNFFGVPGVYQRQGKWFVDKKTPWTGSASYELPVNQYGAIGRFIDYRNYLPH